MLAEARIAHGTVPTVAMSAPMSIDRTMVGKRCQKENRTTTMFTQMVLDNGKLKIAPIIIQPKGSQKITIPLQKLLFLNPPDNPDYFWVWNKKNPPVSPMIYGKDEVGVEVEFWFGVVVDGQEFLSNTVKISIQHDTKKTKKKK